METMLIWVQRTKAPYAGEFHLLRVYGMWDVWDAVLLNNLGPYLVGKFKPKKA